MLIMNALPLTTEPYQEIHSHTGIKLVCGKASITLHPDGRIEMIGTSLVHTAQAIEMQAERVDINP
jgi:hypothetical protein